jgi:hypothetical protein
VVAVELRMVVVAVELRMVVVAVVAIHIANPRITDPENPRCLLIHLGFSFAFHLPLCTVLLSHLRFSPDNSLPSPVLHILKQGC